MGNASSSTYAKPRHDLPLNSPQSSVKSSSDHSHSKLSPPALSSHLPDPVACFLSLFYLYKNWLSIPQNVLKNSIVLLYCRREWVFKFGKSTMKPNNHSIITMIKTLDIPNDSLFLEFLLYKEKQGRLLWIDPCMDTNVSMDDTTDDWIDERWHMISRFLSQFRDPITGDHYENLEFNLKWWQKKFDRSLDLIHASNQKLTFSDIVSPLEYCQHLGYVKDELTNMKWNFNTVLEIISQSIPTLLPMLAYDYDRIKRKKYIYENAPFGSDNDCIHRDTIKVGLAMRTTFLIEDDDGMVYLQ